MYNKRNYYYTNGYNDMLQCKTSSSLYRVRRPLLILIVYMVFIDIISALFCAFFEKMYSNWIFHNQEVRIS